MCNIACRATGVGGGFVAGKVPAEVGMISLCRYMPAWSSSGEHVEKDGRCSVRSTVLVVQDVQGQGSLRASSRRRHGYLPLSDRAWTCASGWGERQQGYGERGRPGFAGLRATEHQRTQECGPTGRPEQYNVAGAARARADWVWQ